MSKLKATIENPYHVSIGAIIRDHNGSYVVIKSGNATAFMCGTIEDGETPEQTLHRELYEEMGATGKITRYAGSSIINATIEMGADFTFQKCILWFDVTLTTCDLAKATDPQGSIVVIAPEKLKLETKDNGRWPHGLIES